jgi:hypothetical protein
VFPRLEGEKKLNEIYIEEIWEEGKPNWFLVRGNWRRKLANKFIVPIEVGDMFLFYKHSYIVYTIETDYENGYGTQRYCLKDTTHNSITLILAD